MHCAALHICVVCSDETMTCGSLHRTTVDRVAAEHGPDRSMEHATEGDPTSPRGADGAGGVSGSNSSAHNASHHSADHGLVTLRHVTCKPSPRTERSCYET